VGDAPAAEQDDLGEGDQVHDAVPVDGDRAELEGDGVELRMNEHVSRRFRAGKMTG
jgi:hypothetical protein